MRQSEDKAVWAIAVAWFLLVLFQLALVVGGIYIVLHFVLKYW